MKLPLRMVGTALLTGALAACHALPALRFYTLDAVSPAAHVANPTLAMLIRVRHISVPHEMDHQGLTHHQGPTELAISDTDEWSAPLDVLIQGTLTRDLGERLGFEHVIGIDALPVASQPDANGHVSPGAVQASLDLDFVTLSAGDRCGINAQVNWTLSVPDHATRRGTAHLTGPATSCPAGLPAALSAALGDLADQLAAQLTTP